MRPVLLGLLARIGVLLGRRSPWGGLRAFVLALGACGLVMGSVAFVLEDSYVQQRDARAQAIKARPAATTKDAEFLIDESYPLVGGRQIIVVSIWPLKADAPLPPGTERWPEPGQAVLSPALADTLGADRDMFGEVVGTIFTEGLVVPRERRVYMRPSHVAFDPGVMEKSSGFGGEGAILGVDAGFWDAADVDQVRYLLVGGLVVPALVVLGIGVGLDGEARSRRRRRLVALGAGRRHRVVVDVAEAWLPVAVGTVAGAGVTGALCAVDVHLPFVDAVLLAGDARAAWPSLVVAVLAGHVGALLMSVLARQRGGRRRGTGVFSVLQSRPMERATLCVFAAIGTIWGPGLCSSPPVRVLIYFAGVLAVAITLPAAISLLIMAAGEFLARTGARIGAVGTLLGGRRLAGFPRRTTRLAFTVCFAVLGIGQIQLWGGGIFASQHRDAMKARSAVGDSVMISNTEVHHDAKRQSFLRGLPKGTETFSHYFLPEDGSVVLSGTCEALSSLSLPCPRTPEKARIPQPAPTPALNYLSRMFRSSDLRVVDEKYLKKTRLAGEKSQILLFSPEGKDLPVNALQRSGCEFYVGCLNLRPLGEGYLVAGAPKKNQGDWIVFLGLVGVLQVLLAAGCAMAGDVIATARETVSLAVVTGRRRWLWANALCRTALPLSLAGVLGSASYLILPSGMLHGERSVSPSLSLAVIAALCSVLAGLLVAAWGALATARATRTWRPGT
ncbi:MAG: hypothetical protein QG608_1421 [Actinomycetota bacterium]|nr:hypothetical protein [Actinomycetota bacterium]